MWFLNPNLTFLDLIIKITNVLFIIFFIFPFHEFCHAWVAEKLGDDTPRLDGRLTLNPLVHFSTLGAVSMLLFRVGWAKPVRTNPFNFKNPRKDMLLVKLAGPLSHIIAAIFGGFLLNFTPFIPSSQVAVWISMFLMDYIVINCFLAVLNLLPLPSLDGFSILEALIPEKYIEVYYRNFFRFQILIILLLFLGVFDLPLNLMGTIIYNFVIRITRIPFSMFL